jgi:hypothetical protein
MDGNLTRRPGCSVRAETAAAQDDTAELVPDDSPELALDDSPELAQDDTSELALDDSLELAPAGSGTPEPEEAARKESLGPAAAVRDDSSDPAAAAPAGWAHLAGSPQDG